MADQEEVKVITVMGRETMVRKLNESALLSLAQIGRGMRDPETPEERRRAVNRLGRLGDILESVFVSEDDVERLHDDLIAGKMNLEEALDVLGDAAKAFNQDEDLRKPTQGPVKTVARRARR